MIANVLSFSRILLGILFILIARNKYAALGIIIIAGLTDILDGFLARKFGETKFGKVIDPFADKFFTLIVIISLMYYYGLNSLYAILMLSRDIIASFGLFYKKYTIKPNIFGKITTGCLFFAFISIILNFYNQIFIFITIGFSIFTGLDYLKLYFSKA